jgi:hypothetical protein
VTALAALLLAAATPGTPAAPAVAATPVPSPVSVTATASKTEVTVGETFTIELKATGPAGTTYTFAGGAETDSFELRTPPPDAKGAPAAAAAPGTHRYEAAVFAVGEAAIPPIPVRYRLADGTEGEASSSPVPVKIVSLLPRDPRDQKLADIRGPLSVGIGRAFWGALVVAVTLGAALVVWLVRRRRKAKAPAPVAVSAVPPDAEALQALAALAGSALLARGEYRPFYIRLTAVAKRYLERRLGAPILEMTTAETLAFLRAHRDGGELLAVVRDLAEAADRIKFARGQGLAEEADRHLAAVRALVPALEARLRPAPSAGAKGKAA